MNRVITCVCLVACGLIGASDVRAQIGVSPYDRAVTSLVIGQASRDVNGLVQPGNPVSAEAAAFLGSPLPAGPMDLGMTLQVTVNGVVVAMASCPIAAAGGGGGDGLLCDKDCSDVGCSSKGAGFDCHAVPAHGCWCAAKCSVAANPRLSPGDTVVGRLIPSSGSLPETYVLDDTMTVVYGGPGPVSSRSSAIVLTASIMALGCALLVLRKAGVWL